MGVCKFLINGLRGKFSPKKKKNNKRVSILFQFIRICSETLENLSLFCVFSDLVFNWKLEEKNKLFGIYISQAITCYPFPLDMEQINITKLI